MIHVSFLFMSKTITNVKFTLSVDISRKHCNSLADEPMLMKLNSDAEYDLRMCMKEDNPGLKFFKGDI